LTGGISAHFARDIAPRSRFCRESEDKVKRADGIRVFPRFTAEDF